MPVKQGLARYPEARGEPAFLDPVKFMFAAGKMRRCPVTGAVRGQSTRALRREERGSSSPCSLQLFFLFKEESYFQRLITRLELSLN